MRLLFELRGFCAEGVAAGLQLLFVCQRFNAGQFLAFEKFEAGSAAGGDVRDLIGYAGLVDGAD
jgi:hypothetical protein